MNLEDMYNNLPRGLKQDLLVSVTVDDPDVFAQNKALCEAKKPNELSIITGLDDFPLPDKIETLVRPNKRVLKNTSSKEQMGKRRYEYFMHS